VAVLAAIRIVKRVPLAGKRTESREQHARLSREHHARLSQTAAVDEGEGGEMADLTSDSAESLGIALPSSGEFSLLLKLTEVPRLL